MEVTADESEKKKAEELSMAQILKMNSPEWYLILIGSISAALAGIAQPMFAILMSEIIAVSTNRTFIFCMHCKKFGDLCRNVRGM